MLVQVLQTGGTNCLLRKLLPNGNWLFGKFEKLNNAFSFKKKVNLQDWDDAVYNGGEVKNITDASKLPEDLFPNGENQT